MVQAQVLDVLSGLVEELGVGHAADQPRPVGARRHLRPDRGDVRRPGGRAGPGRAGVRRPAAPVRRRAGRRRSRGSATRRPASPRPGCPATRRTRASCRRAARSRRAARWRSTSARRPSRRCAASAPAARPPASGSARSVTAVSRSPTATSRPAASRVEFTTRSGDGRTRARRRGPRPCAAGEIVALVGESGSRQDDAGPHADRAASRRRRRGARRRRAAAATGARRCKAFRRRVQLVLQDPAGALNPRHTVYDSVAEGLRLHRLADADPEGRTEERAGRRRAVVGRAAAARGAVPALPARAVRRSAAAGADRRGAGAEPGAADRRRAGVAAWTPRSAARSWRCC